MDELSARWLGSYGVLDSSDIADCDTAAQTVTYKDGSVRQLCEVYSRAMGYYAPWNRYNAGKQAEHRERVYFRENCAGTQALMNSVPRTEPEPTPIPEPTVHVAIDPPALCRYQRVDALAAA